MKPFIVAATPRSGSNLLCEGLEQTGIAGRPAEVFAPDFRAFWCRHFSLQDEVPFAHFLIAAIRYGTTGNGVYGLKIQQEHVALLGHAASFVGEYFEGENDDVLEFLFPGALYVNIVRREVRAQAISFYRALATNEWLRRPTAEEQEADFQLPRPAGAFEFDADAIRGLERRLKRQQEAWERYLWKRGITPVVVEYETLDGDYRGQIARVLEFLGLDPVAASTIPMPRLVRQSDVLTNQWLQQLERGADSSQGHR